MKELECIWGNIPSEESCKHCGVACSSRMPKNRSYSSTDFASEDSKNDAIGLSIMLYLETNLKNENSKVCGVPLKIAREWLREHINDQPMNIPSGGGAMGTTPPSYKLDVKEQPVEGLDVTDFCKPIDPGIAKCVADHWWELLDDENAADKKAVKEIVKTVHKEVTRQVKETVDKQPVEGLEEEYKKWWESITGKINIEHTMEWYMHETARHFAEWGAEHLKR